MGAMLAEQQRKDVETAGKRGTMFRVDGAMRCEAGLQAARKRAIVLDVVRPPREEVAAMRRCGCGGDGTKEWREWSALRALSFDERRKAHFKKNVEPEKKRFVFDQIQVVKWRCGVTVISGDRARDLTRIRREDGFEYLRIL